MKTNPRRLARWICGSTAWLGVLVAWAISGSPRAAEAGDFCIFSKVYMLEETAETTTIFRAGRVYDFLSTEGEITIYDPPGGRFVVLDPTHKIKTEISTDDLEKFATRIKNEAQARQVPLL